MLKLTPVTPDVQPFLDAALARIEQCEATAVQYMANLQQTMENHKHVIELGKAYNSKATAFIFAADDLEEEIEQPLLYQSVAEVQASIEAFETKLRAVRCGCCAVQRRTLLSYCTCVTCCVLLLAEHERADNAVQRD